MLVGGIDQRLAVINSPVEGEAGRPRHVSAREPGIHFFVPSATFLEDVAPGARMEPDDTGNDLLVDQGLDEDLEEDD